MVFWSSVLTGCPVFYLVTLAIRKSQISTSARLREHNASWRPYFSRTKFTAMALWSGGVRSWVRKKSEVNTQGKREAQPIAASPPPNATSLSWEGGLACLSEGQWWERRKCFLLFCPVISVLRNKLVTCFFHATKLVVSSKNKKKGFGNLFFLALSVQVHN